MLQGRTVVLVDDMADTCYTLLNAVNQLIRNLQIKIAGFFWGGGGKIDSADHQTVESAFVNVYGAQESIPRNRFRQPIYPVEPVRQIGLSYRPASLPGLYKKVYKYGLWLKKIEIRTEKDLFSNLKGDES